MNLENINTQIRVGIFINVVAAILLIVPKILRYDDGSFKLQQCFYENKTLYYNFFKHVRSSNYLAENNTSDNKSQEYTCIISTWHLSHILLHFLLGYFAPKHYILWFIIGIGFELFETTRNYADATDIFYNGLGLYFGYRLSPYKK